jgi:hypothetical protein
VEPPRRAGHDGHPGVPFGPCRGRGVWHAPLRRAVGCEAPLPGVGRVRTAP